MTDELVSYIKSELKKGKNKKEIEAILLSTGWERHIIKQTFQSLSWHTRKQNFVIICIMVLLLLMITAAGYAIFHFRGYQQVAQVSNTYNKKRSVLTPTADTPKLPTSTEKVPTYSKTFGLLYCDPKATQQLPAAEKNVTETQPAYDSCIQQNTTHFNDCKNACSGWYINDCLSTCKKNYDDIATYCANKLQKAKNDLQRIKQMYCN